MHLHHLLEENSIAGTFISQLRDIHIQKDRMRFRRNIERLGEILAYEISKKLNYEKNTITTPLGKAKIKLPINELVICSILRAGLPLHTGLLNYYDNAENSFISAYRHHTEKDSFEILVEYLASPGLDNKTLLLADPMLATGQSFVNVMKALEEMGVPQEIHLVAIIGARQGINYIAKHFPEDTHLWIATIDEDLDARGYILPGLGDAGDLAFGSKLQH